MDLWGNPPESVGEVLGSIVPAGVSILSAESWLIIVSYDDSGHIDDADAAGIDYAELLSDMQQSTRENSEERVKQGYEKLELVGWAEAPHYDSQAKKIYWAKQLKFGDAPPPDTLNYNIRALGRTGFLDLTAVAGMNQLPMINSRVNEILGTVSFNIGNRYEDFDSTSDHVAEYGIAGLIAGGVLAKAGFFKAAGAVHQVHPAGARRRRRHLLQVLPPQADRAGVALLLTIGKNSPLAPTPVGERARVRGC